MKKFLSLVLAMIMVMSLVTVGAGAATFTDDAEIVQKEAVALLSGLGILEGPGDGTFNPKGTITRGAAAKILTWMLEGKEKADAIKAAGVTETRFTDEGILNSSNIAFIEYCAQKGIVSGRSDGTFRRADGLTGQAFLKMVLVALGVTDIDFNTATNPGWPVDAVAAAQDMGLLEGISEEYAYSTLLSREDACQIAFNALVNYTAEGAGYVIETLAGAKQSIKDLAADETVYESRTEAMAEIAIAAKDAVYGVDYVLTKDSSDTLGAKVYGIKAVTGTVLANAATDKTLKAGETKVEGTKYNFASDLSLLGHEVTVYFNDKPTKAADKNVYAVYDNSKTLAVTTSTTLKTVNAALEAEEEDDAIVLATGFIQWTETSTQAATPIAATDIFANNDKATLKATDKSAYTGTLIITDGKISGVINTVKTTLDQVKTIEDEEGKEYIELVGFGKLENGELDADKKAVDIVKEYADIAEDDYVVVTKAGDFYTLTKATIVTGKPTKVDGTKITINGKEYAKNGNLANNTALNDATATLTEEITLYVDAAGKWLVKTSDKAAAVADIVYVADKYIVEVKAKSGTTDEFGVTTGATIKHDTYFVQAVTMDGEQVIYPVKAANYAGITVDALAKVTVGDKEKDTQIGGIGTADTKDDVYVEAKFATFTTTPGAKDELFLGATTLAAELKATAIKLGSDYFAEDVSFIWVYGDKSEIEIAVKSGVQALDTATSIEFVYSIDEASKAKVIEYVIVEADPDGKVEYTGDVVYVVKAATSTKQVTVYTDKAGDEQVAYEHEIYVNGVKTKVVLDSNNVTAGFKKMTAVVEGVYKLETLTENVVENAKVTGMFKGKITIAGVKAEDIDVTGVQVVDTTSATTKITDATKITTANEVSVVLSKVATNSTNSIVTIYITK